MPHIFGDRPHPREFEITADRERFLTPNLIKVFRSIDEGELSKLVALYDMLQKGGAKETEAEITQVYEAFQEVVPVMLDLAHMCRRREEKEMELAVSMREAGMKAIACADAGERGR